MCKYHYQQGRILVEQVALKLPHLVSMHSWTRQALKELREDDEDREECDCNITPEEYYWLDTKKLDEPLASCYVPLQADAATREFLDSAQDPLWRHFLASALTVFFDYSYVNNLLSRGQLFVVSAEQVEKLLHRVANFERERRHKLLDVGAADGNVTLQLEKLGFDTIVATEVESHFVRTLKSHGFVSVKTDSVDAVKQYGPFDMVSCLNVVDRCDFPMQMLRDIKDALCGDGVLLMSVVLPLNDFVRGSSGQMRPPVKPLTEGIPRCGSHSQFETAMRAFHDLVLSPLGLHVKAVSRVPYLCGGDAYTSWYALPNAIFVLGK
eukprot:gb/GECG01004082.1/.p1 GENE.gb/GECG01004082.1/~~gb/GECG01004082.1/.p1  ORF type:complete len:323 (+),score=32.38 gb/GECG01004082.1/:1-969(+)